MRNNQIEYYPNQKFEHGLWAMYGSIGNNIVSQWNLIAQLYKRDFTAQYKKSFIGLGWAFITPVFGMLSWVLMRFTGVLNPGELGIPYPVYILVGTVCWKLFVSMMEAGGKTLQSGKSLIQQVKYPHEVLLVQQLLLQLTTFAISLVLVALVISAFGVLPHWKVIFLPLVIIPAIFLGSGIGLILSMVSVVAIDISKFVNNIMNFLIYTVPIIYSDLVDNVYLRLLNKWNPLTYLVCSIRDVILFGSLYDTHAFFIVSLFSMLFFMLVLRTFYVCEDKLVERMI